VIYLGNYIEVQYLINLGSVLYVIYLGNYIEVQYFM